jgi:S-phase kinase-associated protein 1
MEYHDTTPWKEIEKPLKNENLEEAVEKWDVDFINVEQPLLFALVQGSNYLDIHSLFDLSCAKVASMIHGKNSEQIRQSTTTYIHPSLFLHNKHIEK